MPEWKIMITDGLDENGQVILRSAAQVDDRDGITQQDLIREISEYDALVVRGRTKITASVFEAAQRLKVAGRAGVGIDNIDLAAANAKGVIVVNAPLSTTLAVAEHTLALMMALARSIPRADVAMKAGQWIKKELQGVELSGKALGILGIGNIGRAIAERARVFGMSVLGYDALLTSAEIRSRQAEPVSISELYRSVDFLTIHVPLTPETRDMINGQSLAQMKRGVRIICTARGGIIDETALLGALETGQVAAAALDVFEKEPPGLSALVAHPNVIATPHIAAQTREAQQRAAVDIAHEVLAALGGKPLHWRIM